MPDAPPVQPSILAGQNIFVTGATGSFGHAFVRRALADGARRIVCFSRDELKQAQMRAEFAYNPRLRLFVGDVRDAERVARAMDGCELVVHAAAMKRIEVCENNPEEAIRTNVLGTLNVAKAAIDAGASRACFLSTDKAPNAATLYGATKFCAERLWRDCNVYAGGKATRLAAVRYGNVLGSRGSVLDLFRKQHAAGEPITVTDERMSRFWMTLDQAVDLVCLALSEMRGGETFVPKAPSAPLMTLVSAIAGHNAPIRAIGLRSDERMHETLIASDEARLTHDCGDHYRVEPDSRSWGDESALPFPRVPADFSYRSDTNAEQLSVKAMRALVPA